METEGAYEYFRIEAENSEGERERGKRMKENLVVYKTNIHNGHRGNLVSG